MKHDGVFKPNDFPKTDPITTIHPHMADFDHTKKKNYRNAEGKVAKGPNNILVSGYKSGVGSRTVGHLLNKIPPFMKDEYDRKRQLDKEENKKHHEKL